MDTGKGFFSKMLFIEISCRLNDTMEIEEDTYSSIFQALKHPIRRRILRMLKEQPLPYTEILNELGIDNGLLNYHLENLRELLSKGEDEKYVLSEFGEVGLSVIDGIEIPKGSYAKPSYLRTDNLSSVLLIILLFSSALLNGYFYLDNRNMRSKNLQLSLDHDNTVSGIVINRSGKKIWLRLSLPDHINNKDVGDIMVYNLHENSIDIDAGDYVKGKLTGNLTLLTELIIPFFQYDYHEGFMISGDFLLFSGGGISNDLSKPFPTLRFVIKNLGDMEIIAVRAMINELYLPYTFGVSENSPLRPSRQESYSRYTAWYEPGGGTGGYLPIDGEEYNITVTVKFSDLSTQTFTMSGVFKESGIGSIELMMSRGCLFFREPDLLWLGLGEGSALSLSLRNEWRKKSDQEITNDIYQVGKNYMQTVERLELYLEDTLVWEEDIRIEPSRYFAATVHVPRELVPGHTYDVTIVAHSQEGLNSTYTVPTLCQYIRIH